LKLKIRQYEISIATLEDSGRILELAFSLYKNSLYNEGSFNHRKVKDLIDKVITGDRDENIILCLWKDNVIIGSLGACVFNPLWNEDKIASELFFFSSSGITLLIDAYESWARSVGCKSMQLGIDHKKRRTFKGFVATEQMYTKRLF
jgi:hypothetical protein